MTLLTRLHICCCNVLNVADKRKALNTDIKVYCGDFILIKSKPFLFFS